MESDDVIDSTDEDISLKIISMFLVIVLVIAQMTITAYSHYGRYFTPITKTSYSLLFNLRAQPFMLRHTSWTTSYMLMHSHCRWKMHVIYVGSLTLIFHFPTTVDEHNNGMGEQATVRVKTGSTKEIISITLIEQS